MRLLFATTMLPTTERSGGELVSLALINGLRQLGHHVTVTGYLRPGAPSPTNADSIVIEHRPVETAASGARAIAWLMESGLRRIPYTSAKYRSGRYGAAVEDLIAADKIDAVVIDHTQMWWLREHIPAHIPTVLMMHNAESALYASGATRAESPVLRALYRREARLLKRVEACAAAEAGVWVLSESDAASMRKHSTRASILVLPVIPEQPSKLDAEPSCDIALLATWTWQPNADALRRFVSEILPQLPSSVSVRVAGPGAEWLHGCDSRMAYLGFVDDAAAFLRSARVVAVPTRYGSGVETKMFAAIATGRPIVATSTSVRGLGSLPNTVIIADSPESFARSLNASLATATASSHEIDAWWTARRGLFLEALDSGVAGLVREFPQRPNRAQKVELIRDVA